MEILLQNKESSLFIKQCLSDLPLNYRMPLELFYFEEKSYTDIGEILRLPMGTVSTRINRAKKMLKIIYTRATKLRHPEHMPQTVPRLDSWSSANDVDAEINSAWRRQRRKCQN